MSLLKSKSECDQGRDVEEARRNLEAIWHSDIDNSHLQNGCAERLSLAVTVEMAFAIFYGSRVDWGLRQKHVEGSRGDPARPVPLPQIDIVDSLWCGDEYMGGVVGMVSVGGLEPPTHHARRRMAVEALTHAVMQAWTNLCTLHSVKQEERGIELFPTVDQVLDRLKSDFHD